MAVVPSDVLDVLERAEVSGNALKLTGQLDRNLYTKVAKTLCGVRPPARRFVQGVRNGGEHRARDRPFPGPTRRTKPMRGEILPVDAVSMLEQLVNQSEDRVWRAAKAGLEAIDSLTKEVADIAFVDRCRALSTSGRAAG